MRFRQTPVFVVVCLLCLTGCSKQPANQASAQQSQAQRTPITSQGVVSVVTAPVQIPAGGSADGFIEVKVQSGYHINANPPTYPYLKATEVEIKPSGGLSVGFITYPNSIVKKFPFAEKPLAIYEGETQLKVLLKAAPSANKGTSNLAGKLKVQACDDQVCYPP